MNRPTILQAIQELPPDEQEKLLEDIYALLPNMEKPLSAPNSSRLASFFSNGKEPPSDEQVAQ